MPAYRIMGDGQEISKGSRNLEVIVDAFNKTYSMGKYVEVELFVAGANGKVYKRYASKRNLELALERQKADDELNKFMVNKFGIDNGDLKEAV